MVSGTAWMKVMVYDYDRYDAAQIAQMKVGDTISLEGQLVTVSTLERDHTGEVKINGQSAALDYRKPSGDADADVKLTATLDDASR